MSVPVPERRLSVAQRIADGTDVTAITRSVRGVTWIDAARLQCWLAGRGSMEVPSHAPMVTIAASGSSTFAYRVAPRYQTCRYAYSVCVSAAAPDATRPLVNIGGTDYTIPCRPRREATPITICLDAASQSTSERTLSLEIKAPSGYAIDVESIGIEALPRTLIEVDANDLGIDRMTLGSRSPIYVTSLATNLLGRQNDLRNACRRVGMFQHSVGTDSPWTITTASPSWEALLTTGIGILGRQLYSTDTTRTLSWRVYAKCSDGTTAGSIRINNDSGTAASTITIPAGTTGWTWLPAANPGTFSADCEDNTTATGLRGGAYDDHTSEVQRTAGAGSVQIASISVFEA